MTRIDYTRNFDGSLTAEGTYDYKNDFTIIYSAWYVKLCQILYRFICLSVVLTLLFPVVLTLLFPDVSLPLFGISLLSWIKILLSLSLPLFGISLFSWDRGFNDNGGFKYCLLPLGKTERHYIDNYPSTSLDGK